MLGEETETDKGEDLPDVTRQTNGKNLKILLGLLESLPVYLATGHILVTLMVQQLFIFLISFSSDVI